MIKCVIHKHFSVVTKEEEDESFMRNEGWHSCSIENEFTHTKLLGFASLSFAKYKIGFKKIVELHSCYVQRCGNVIKYKLVFSVMFVDGNCIKLYGYYSCDEFENFQSSFIYGRGRHCILDGDDDNNNKKLIG